jgi:ATP-dependent RNA helicase RhlE
LQKFFLTDLKNQSLQIKMTFKDLNLIPQILEALQTEGYTEPTPIQQRSIPILLQKRDLLGCAQTGTGKTAAFAIPILQILHQKRQPDKGYRPIKALILTPTRELAIQIGESFKAYGDKLPLRHAVIFGGVPQKPQEVTLKHGVDILVATPGRLADLINQRIIKLNEIQIFVLDEADRMLDMGFVHEVKRIITLLPKQRQTLFFSATMPPEIATLANTILTNPEKVEVTPVSTTAETINQSLYYVDKGNKKSLLIHLLKDKSIASVLVFMRTKHGCNKIAVDLNKAGIHADAIHGNKSQNARQKALEDFKMRRSRVLVATDIAARGIDVDNLTHVINYELPNVPETYVHRIGRTGRAGASGIAISFCEAEEKPYLKDIQKLIARSIPVEDHHPFPMEIHEIVPAPKVPSPYGGSGGSNRGGGRNKPQNRNSGSNNKSNNGGGTGNSRPNPNGGGNSRPNPNGGGGNKPKAPANFR